MNAAPHSAFSLTSSSADERPAIAGYPFTVGDRAGGIINLRIGLRGEPLVALARALAKLDGVRVTSGPKGAGSARCYLVNCLGFKMVLSTPADGADDVALALVSRAPQVALAVISELGSLLDRLMSEPTPLPVTAPARTIRFGRTRAGVDAGKGEVGAEATTSLRRSALRPGQPIARKTELKRKTPLARGPFKRS